MLTFGYITKLNQPNDNLFEVRLPIFEKAGSSKTSPALAGSLFMANLCYNPGNLNAYKVGDCVVVGFIDNRYDQAIILGKLYTGDETEATNFSFANSLKVVESAQLPENTTIGGVSLDSIVETIRRTDNLSDRLDADED